MRINLSPMRRDDTLTVSRSGDVVMINGTAYDFTPIPNGATLPRDAVGCEWLASDVERVNGVIEFTLILPHGAGASQAVLFPKQINSTANGAVRLPE